MFIWQMQKSVAIAGHVRPDGDCAGSCLATYNYIKKLFSTCEGRSLLRADPEYFQVYEAFGRDFE